MAKDSRSAALQKLQNDLGYSVLAYVTSTRPKAEAQMSIDAVRFVYEHLRLLGGKQDRIGLLIHSFGGEPGTSWRLMNLVREYTASVTVLVPYQAFSAATLLALGADEILMHPMAALGPTDPSIMGPFNPKDPSGQSLPISVEDVLSYISLVKDDVRINHEDELIVAFSDLVKQVHPLALGNVKRSHSQARLLAKKLMELRAKTQDSHKITEIVDNLTSKLYYHGHPINRVEARSLELDVVDPSPDIQEAMWDVYTEFEADMNLTQELNINAELSSPSASPLASAPNIVALDLEVPMVYVQSVNRSDVYVNQVKLTGTKDNSGSVTGGRVVFQKSGWRVE